MQYSVTRQIKQSYYREKNISKGYNFICAMDLSSESLEMLEFVRRLASRKEDKVYVLHVAENEETTQGWFLFCFNFQRSSWSS